MIEKLNIVSWNPDKRAQYLSNFCYSPFILDGERWESVEGFIQGIKFPEGDSRREMLRRAAGRSCKSWSHIARREFGNRIVWWRDKEIPYGSPEHLALIERAISQKFSQDSKAQAALRATKGVELVHDLGHPETPRTSLPAKEFIRILTTIRDELLNSGGAMG